MKVQFKCPAFNVSVKIPQFTPKVAQSKVPVKNPTWIGSISRTGIVELKFYTDVFVPTFTN